MLSDILVFRNMMAPPRRRSFDPQKQPRPEDLAALRRRIATRKQDTSKGAKD